MKLIIFAGGIGTRLWPLSRENSPKQFDKIFNNKSTLQLAIERLKSKFSINDILVQTLENYVPIIKEQISDLPSSNIILEPSRRNLGPAVCLSVLELKKRSYNGPMAILWADHLMERPEEFVNALSAAEQLIEEDDQRFVFLAEKARFANNNLGWIHIGEKIDAKKNFDCFSFRGWRYKPEIEECNKMYKSGEYFWNPGYFVTSVNFLEEQYRILAPKTYQAIKSGNYQEAEAVHFDRAIIEKVDLSRAVILKTDMGWSDPGTLYALKEALASSSDETIKKGNVAAMKCSDSLIYNLEDKKLVAAIGLNGMIVVNTDDALIVLPKEEVVNITNLVNRLREEKKDDYL